ncbi:hypothetical protein ACJIZ3_024403 [Penstemon smallii]|uniref:Phytocyanin domain-containing protein n=1 Tax=Penstemon smallii TaxID=265156 RepID=A0ABD3TU74_9LAMI
MANNLVSIYGLLILVSASTLFIRGATETYTVGDDLGWTVPPLGELTYRTWATEQDFVVGDRIRFEWSGSGTENVVQVNREGYEECRATNSYALSPIETNSPFTYRLNSTETYYFICTVDNHCRLGQRVAIQASSSAASSSLAVALSVILLAINILCLF